jgi:hypothetical protein
LRCGIGLAQILAGFGSQQARSVLAADPSYGPGWVVLYELGELCWELSWALLAVLLLLFPTGRLPSRRWRPVAWAAGAVLVLAALLSPFLPGPPADGLRPNPIAIPALAGVLRLAYDMASSVLFGVILAALVSLVVRFRRATVRLWHGTAVAAASGRSCGRRIEHGREPDDSRDRLGAPGHHRHRGAALSPV